MYLLVVVAFISGSASGPSYSMHEFKTAEQCEIAKNTVLGMVNLKFWTVRAECAALGEGE